MTKVIVDTKDLQEIRDMFNRLDVPKYYKDDKADVEERFDKIMRSFYQNVESAPGTMEISTELFLEMTKQLAQAGRTKDRIKDALVDMWTYIPEWGTDDQVLWDSDLLYENLGKDGARTVKGYLGHIAECAGLESYQDVEQEANIRLNNAIRYKFDITFPSNDKRSEFIAEAKQYISDNTNDGDVVPQGRVERIRVKLDEPITTVSKSGREYTEYYKHESVDLKYSLSGVSRYLKSELVGIIKNHDGEINDESFHYDFEEYR